MSPKMKTPYSIPTPEGARKKNFKYFIKKKK
jgi:hypothetical protein